MSRFVQTMTGIDAHERSGAALREQEPVLVLAGVALLVASTAICVGLLVPALWTIATEDGTRPILTYDRCGATREAPLRLACFDDVLRRTRRGAIDHAGSGGS
jgi:hypothetical protein